MGSNTLGSAQINQFVGCIFYSYTYIYIDILIQIYIYLNINPDDRQGITKHYRAADRGQQTV
jgi:hypothetical protein